MPPAFKLAFQRDRLALAAAKQAKALDPLNTAERRGLFRGGAGGDDDGAGVATVESMHDMTAAILAELRASVTDAWLRIAPPDLAERLAAAAHRAVA